MARFLVILVAAVLVAFGVKYYIDGGGGKWNFWGALGDNSQPTATPQPGSASSSASPTPADHSIEGCRVSLKTLEQSVLLPIDSPKPFSTGDATLTLQNAANDLKGFKAEPDYKNLMQACGLLDMALRERAGFVERVQRSGAGTSLDKAPSTGPKLATATLSGATSNADFFKEAALRDWRQRVDYYRPQIERLLTPSY